MDKLDNDFKLIKENFISFLKDKGYKDSSLFTYSNHVDIFFQFISDNKLSLNDDGIHQYLDYVNSRNIKDHSKSLIKSYITRFRDFINGENYILLHPYNQVVLPAISNDNKELLNSYLAECVKKGNKAVTIKQKEIVLTRFISECEKRNTDMNSLNSSLLSKILPCFLTKRYEHWAIISNFLLYLFKDGYLKNNLSSMIPKTKSKQVIPTVYSTDEIKRIEESIDTSTFKGKRDKAALLLATRLGVRASDIVNLELSNFNFKKNQLSFVQVKTNNPIALPIVNDLKEALLDYTKEREKIETSSNKLFIRARLPYNSFNTGSALNYALNVYIGKAKIDTSNRKHGLHSMRSSLASSMVNDNVSYEIVRKVLGHSDDNVIKHYAKLDIEELRKCALEVPPPTGRFEAFLKGGILVNE